MKIRGSLVVQSSGVTAPREGPQESPRERRAQHREIVHAIKAINESGGMGPDSELQLAIDPGSGQPLIKIVDRETNEVVGEVSPEAVLRAAAVLGKSEDDGQIA